MFTRLFAGAVALAAGAGLASCGLPPITTGEQSFTIPYSMFVPSFARGLPVPIPAFPGAKAPATTLPLPGEARTVRFSSVNLNLKLRNTGPLPLSIKLYLSPDGVDPYTTAPLGGDQPVIELPAKGTEDVSRSFSIDPALLQSPQLKLGYTFSSPGSGGLVTFTEDDAVLVRHSVTLQPKLF